MKRRWKSMPMKRKNNLMKHNMLRHHYLCSHLDEVEVVQPCSPPVHEVEEATSLSDEEFEDPVEATPTSTLPAHEDKEMIIFSHVDGLMKEPLDMVDEHIDTFIQTGDRWDFGHLIFYRDPIYDIEGSPQEKGFELSSSEDYFSCIYDSYVWKPDDDMITDLFEDDRSQHFQDDFQSSLGTCDAYIFGDADLLYEDSQPPSSSILEEYQDMAISERSEVHSTKRKYFHIEDFYRDSQMKRPHFSFSRPEVVPYLISSSQEAMQSSSDLSSPLSLQQAVDLCA
jgi:hypothetical protein